MRSKFTLFLFVFYSTTSIAIAQEKKDSLYYKIEEYSDKRKSTKFLHRLIFRRAPDSIDLNAEMAKPQQVSYDGKIIRNITIQTIDPFGYKNISGSEKSKWYDRLADRIHIDSKKSTINNYLLFKTGEKYNAQRLYESERILRNTSFVNRVNIAVIDSTSSKDSIDIIVKVLDSWTLKPRLRYSSNKIGLGIQEDNLLGLGHEVDFLYTNNSKDQENEIFGRYTANNILGTFINASIIGEKDFADNERMTFSAARNFFSPLTRWAGGFSFEYFMRKVLMPDATFYDLRETQIKVYHQDLWGGYQFPVFKSNKNEISRNIAVLGRVQNFNYKDRPAADSQDFFSSYQSFLAAATFIERKFSVQKNIFQYNLPEDIPYGKSFGITGGALKRNGKITPYAGISASWGRFINWGYVNVKGEYGRFFNENEENSNSLRLEGIYFTNLQDWKFAKARHFFSTTFARGNERFNSSYKDRINLSAENEFPAYSTNYIGIKKLIFNYQLQFFIDKTWKNFHFSPYALVSLGWLSQPHEQIFKANMNSKFGIGVLLDNPYLVFNRIQLSFVYYPKLPFENKSAFDFNGYRNSDMSLNTFATDIPHFVNFQN